MGSPGWRHARLDPATAPFPRPAGRLPRQASLVAPLRGRVPRLLALLGIVLSGGGPAFAARIVRTISWDSGERRVESTIAGRHRVRVATIEKPAITLRRYAVRTRARHRLTGTAFLEMWSVWPGGRRYFSRTLAPRGPMRPLRGASASRWVVLPFVNRPGNPPPARLEINVVFDRPGVVHLGPLVLVELSPGEDPLLLPGAWWDDRTAGWLGAVLGTLLGLAAALLGWLAVRGRARRAVLAAVGGMAGLCLALLGAGAVAGALAQPYPVTFPLLLTGGLGTLLAALLWVVARRRYRDHELRRMRALDAGGD